MAPVRPSKGMSILSQPPKGTQHRQKARRHVHDGGSNSEESQTTTKISKTMHKRRHVSEPSSSDDSSDKAPSTQKKRPKKKQKKKPSSAVSMVDTEESGDEVSPQDNAPEDLDENELAPKKAIASWTSPIYDHYHSPSSINVEDGIVKYIFTCKCHDTTHTRAKKDTSTTNLKHHAERCDLKAKTSTMKQLKIDEVASQYTHGEFRLLHAEWMAQSHRPQAIIADHGLQKIYHLLNPRVQIHSETTVGRDIKEVYEVSKDRLKEMLKEHEGRFHIAFNAWAAPNHHDYLDVVLIWCRDGHIEVVTLDLIELTKALEYTLVKVSNV